MAHKFRFEDRYEKQLAEIKQQFSIEELQLYSKAVQYSKADFIGILGEEKYQDILKKVKKAYEVKKEELDFYKEFKIVSYINDRLFRYLNSREFEWGWENIVASELRENFLEDDIDNQDEFVLFDIQIENIFNLCLETDKGNKPTDYKRYFERHKLNETKIWKLRKFYNEIHNRSSKIYYGVKFDPVGLTEWKFFVLIAKEWKQFAYTKMGRDGWKAEKERLLYRSNDRAKQIKMFMECMKNKYKNWEETCAAETYVKFLCIHIFQDSHFWKLYECDSKDLQLEFLDGKIGALLLHEYLMTGEARKDVEKRIASVINVEENILFELKWFYPRSGKDFFKENFDRYSFYRCFSISYLEYFGGESMGRRFLDITSGFNQGWRGNIRQGFEEWKDITNVPVFQLSILKDVLHIILSGTTIKKDHRLILGEDEKQGYYTIDTKGHRRNVWFISELRKNYEITLKQHFSPEYQMYSIDKGTKTTSPQSLIDKFLLEESQVEYFESYILEIQECVLTAWKVYDIFYEILGFENQDDILEIIRAISKEIGRIHNLELRLCIIKKLEACIREILSKPSHNLKNSLEFISDRLRKEVDSFNIIYNKMLLKLIYVYREESRWSSLLWLKNCEMPNFTELLELVKSLSASYDGQESYCYMKFSTIYKTQKVSKGTRYSQYNLIRKSIKENSDTFDSILS